MGTETSFADLAVRLLEAGFVPLPVKNDGSKAPMVSAWPTEPPTEATVRSWFPEGTEGIGVLTGAISGELEMLEIEGRFIDRISDFSNAFMRFGLEELKERLWSGWVEVSPSKGVHFHYRVSDGPALGNTKLARDKDGCVTIETRGARGFTILAPSRGTTHPSGEAWWSYSEDADFSKCITLTVAERDALYSALSTLDEKPVPGETPVSRPPRADRPSEGRRPGDDYNARSSWDEVLAPHGWRRLSTDSAGETHWQRPGKDGGGESATTGHQGSDNLYVFSTSTVFPSEKPLTKFAAYAILNHNGDFAAAAAELNRQGFGDRATARSRTDVADPGSPRCEAAPL